MWSQSRMHMGDDARMMCDEKIAEPGMFLAFIKRID